MEEIFGVNMLYLIIVASKVERLNSKECTCFTKVATMPRPAKKLTGLDFVPKEYFFWMKFKGEFFYKTKSKKKVRMSAPTKKR